jgi:hypothetical protein
MQNRSYYDAPLVNFLDHDAEYILGRLAESRATPPFELGGDQRENSDTHLRVFCRLPELIR